MASVNFLLASSKSSKDNCSHRPGRALEIAGRSFSVLRLPHSEPPNPLQRSRDQERVDKDPRFDYRKGLGVYVRILGALPGS